jgi:prepilin-type N-terminal cleavage/methylation domain-containing protein
MKNKKGLSLIELLVVFAIIAMLIAIFTPALGRIKYIPRQVICGTNLKGIGTAMSVYAQDYEGRFPQLPGSGPWSKDLGFDYDNLRVDFTGVQSNTPRTITASWYLLVKEADVAPRSFVCPISEQKEFEGKNPKNLDIVELWDFGKDPHKHVSYAMHNPYGKFPANTKLPSGFAVAADMSPWFKDGMILGPNNNKKLPPQIINLNDKSPLERSNSLNHSIYDVKFFSFRFTRHKNCGIAQNVLYADGHNSFEKTSNIGVNQDNIYTYWSKDTDPNKQDIQGGTAPTDRNPENDAKSKDDSFLAI